MKKIILVIALISRTNWVKTNSNLVTPKISALAFSKKIARYQELQLYRKQWKSNFVALWIKPGVHAIHIHEKSDCSAADGSSAGGH
jgi:Cu-Zn family superoxide dismutase